MEKDGGHGLDGLGSDWVDWICLHTTIMAFLHGSRPSHHATAFHSWQHALHHSTPFGDFDDTCITSCHAISVTTACMQHVMLHNIPYMSWDSIFTWIACRAFSSRQIGMHCISWFFLFLSGIVADLCRSLLRFFWTWWVPLLNRTDLLQVSLTCCCVDPFSCLYFSACLQDFKAQLIWFECYHQTLCLSRRRRCHLPWLRRSIVWCRNLSRATI